MVLNFRCNTKNSSILHRRMTGLLKLLPYSRYEHSKVHFRFCRNFKLTRRNNMIFRKCYDYDFCCVPNVPVKDCPGKCLYYNYAGESQEEIDEWVKSLIK